MTWQCPRRQRSSAAVVDGRPVNWGEPIGFLALRATRLSDVQAWHLSLQRLRAETACKGPGFFMPYHFVTLALLLKELDAGQVNLPPEVTAYAARMRLWEALGLQSPIDVPQRDSGSRFHELTPLVDLNSVGNVAEALKDVILNNVGAPCSDETGDSLFITLTELLGNCHHHARAADGLHGLVCAQTWYQNARAQFAIGDSGIGVRRSLGESVDLVQRLGKENACTLATKLGVSSKLNKGHAGYGLAVARDLALQTPGSMLMVQSLNEVFMVEHGKIVEMNTFDHALPGTLVVFEWDMKKPLDIGAVYAGWPQSDGGDNEFF